MRSEAVPKVKAVWRSEATETPNGSEAISSSANMSCVPLNEKRIW